jgi:hypothetical protein
MSYSKSKRVVRQYESYLSKLLSAQTSITFPDRNPSRLGYKLREAIFASQFFPDTKQYANLQSKFLFRLKSLAITCELRDQIETYDSVSVLKQVKAEVVIQEVDSLMGLMTAVLKHKADYFGFPNIPDLESYAPLDNFCVKYGYTYSKHPEGGLELIKIDNPT